MPPPNKRQKHSNTLAARRSIDSLPSESSEDYSDEEKKEETVPSESDDQIDYINFKDDSIIHDISDLFSFCETKINTRYLSTLIYMSLRRFGHTFRDADLFLSTIGGMTAKTCKKWTDILVNHDFDDFVVKAYHDGKDYLEVLSMFFSGLCKDKILSHRKITNTNIDD
ncbi:unnamed protein product [Rotaria sp. Silwood2]|nr:unnamed protein product [Rotaria sp. Silwood2]